MKNFLFVFTSLIASLIWAGGQRVEVSVARVFVPATGFDDNDTVEAVLDGELPNSCYSIEKTVISTDQKNINLKQFAIKQMDGLCDPSLDQSLPQLSTPVPFSVTVTVGRLESGRYQIQFSPAPGRVETRSFGVDIAIVPTVDSLPYAKITQINVDDVYVTGQHVKVELKGLLNNSCYELDKVEAVTLDDVTILLPTVAIRRSGPCLMVIRPFSKVVDLGKLSVARRLVHVRSMDGRSVNRTFSVNPQS